MPRTKANPDPQVVTHERKNPPAGLFTITAWRDGRYTVTREGGDKALFAKASQLGAYLGAPRFPSNRLQEEAIADAKSRIEIASASQLE